MRCRECFGMFGGIKGCEFIVFAWLDVRSFGGVLPSLGLSGLKSNVWRSIVAGRLVVHLKLSRDSGKRYTVAPSVKLNSIKKIMQKEGSMLKFLKKNMKK